MSAAPPIEIPLCACGESMVAFSSGSGYFCDNCDRLQPQEICEPISARRARARSDRDLVFAKVWRERLRKFYPNLPRRWPDGKIVA